jgi:chorismate mutase / prephenate dehydratase
MADSSSSSEASDLLAFRTQIDSLDRDLLALLNRRATLAQQVGELKKREGSVAFRPEREAQVIDGLKTTNPGPLKSESVAPIWREIMSACRALESPTRVAYLGPAGTFSELAALGFFGSITWASRSGSSARPSSRFPARRWTRSFT